MKKIVFLFYCLMFSCAFANASEVSNNEDKAVSVLAERAAESYSWTGAYAGVNLGAIWSGSDFTAYHPRYIPVDGNYNGAISGTDVNPGLQFGYLKQFKNNWVIGAEADFTYPSSRIHFQQNDPIDSTLFDRFTVNNTLQGSLRLRMGYAMERFLPFITAGVSFASMGMSYNNDINQAYSKSTSQTGWVLGGGIEYGVLDNLSVRTEYLYTDYGSALNLATPTVQDPAIIQDATVSNGGAHATMYTNVLRVAVNYRF